MEHLPSFETALSAVEVWAARLMTIEMPIPDVALLVAFLLAAYATRLNNRSRMDRARAEVEDVYQAELLLANRRAQQARGALRRAQLEIERERQKRRREHGRSDAARRRAVTAKPAKKPARKVKTTPEIPEMKLEQTS